MYVTMFVYWALLLKKDTVGRSGWSQLVHRLLPFQDICRYMVRIRSLSNQNIFFLTLAICFVFSGGLERSISIKKLYKTDITEEV